MGKRTAKISQREVMDAGLPIDDQQERTVLGSILLEPTLYFEKSTTLSVDDFYQQGHQEIYRAIMSLADLEKPINLVTIHDEMVKTGTAAVVPSSSPIAYIASLTDGVPRRAAKDFDWMVERLQHFRIRRNLIRACWNTIAEAQTNGVDPKDTIAELDSNILVLSSDNPSAQAVKVCDVFPAVYNRLKTESQYDLNGPIQGYKLGIHDFDDAIGGLRRKEMSLWGGYQKEGKTSAAIQAIAENTCRLSIPTLYLSHEMDRDSVVLRLISALSDIPFFHLRNPKLMDDFDHSSLDRLKGKFDAMPLFIEDVAMDLASVAARTRLHCRRDKCELIIVDFIQKVDVPGLDKKHEQVSKASDTIRVLAKNENCHAMVLSQLSTPEGKKKVAPNQFMFKESGDPAADAHLAVAVWRPVDKDNVFTGEDEWRIVLQRSGPTGTAVPVRYNTEKLIFEERKTTVVKQTHRDDN